MIEQAVLEKLNAKYKIEKCPICFNKGKWNVVGESKIHFSDKEMIGRSLPFIICICEECGFLNLHAKGAFVDLEESQKKEVSMQVKDPVIKRFLAKIKHPAVVTFIILLLILLIMGLIVDFIRPEPIPDIGMV